MEIRFSSTDRLNVRNRRGIAPLEMVMSLPFLVAMFAMITSLLAAAQWTARCSHSARHEVWKLRGGSSDGSPVVRKEVKETRPFQIIRNANPLSGSIYGEVEKEMHLAKMVGDATAKGRALIVVNTWDHKAIEGDFDGNGPHVNIMARMGEVLALSAVMGLASIRNIESFEMPDLSEAQGQLAEAEQQVSDMEEEYRQKIKELEEQYEKEKEKRDGFVKEKQALEKKRDELDDKIAELEARIAAQDPPSPALLKELEGLKADRDQLTKDIAAKQRQIDASEAEMRRIQAELRKWQQGMQNANNDISELPE